MRLTKRQRFSLLMQLALSKHSPVTLPKAPWEDREKAIESWRADWDEESKK